MAAADPEEGGGGAGDQFTCQMGSRVPRPPLPRSSVCVSCLFLLVVLLLLAAAAAGGSCLVMQLGQPEFRRELSKGESKREGKRGEGEPSELAKGGRGRDGGSEGGVGQNESFFCFCFFFFSFTSEQQLNCLTDRDTLFLPPTQVVLLSRRRRPLGQQSQGGVASQPRLRELPRNLLLTLPPWLRRLVASDEQWDRLDLTERDPCRQPGVME